MINAAIVGLGWWGKTLVESLAEGSDLMRFTTLQTRQMAELCLRTIAELQDGKEVTEMPKINRPVTKSAKLIKLSRAPSTLCRCASPPRHRNRRQEIRICPK